MNCVSVARKSTLLLVGSSCQTSTYFSQAGISVFNTSIQLTLKIYGKRSGRAIMMRQYATAELTLHSAGFVSDIAVFVLKRDAKLQLTHSAG